MSTQDDLLSLSKEIYIYKVVFTPSWDLQQHARDAMDAATQFYLAVHSAQNGPTEQPPSTPAPPQAPDQTQQQSVLPPAGHVQATPITPYQSQT